MPAETKRAVFLSYASQDAEAAQRICDALRAADIEVWFDRNELRGGDAWDQKIRRQIKECTLFLPIVSANTNARPEGYFRLEWHLAEQRTYLMAHDQPFLVPVVVDDTSDAAARVPERFRERQWTRLPGGNTPADFCNRVQRLLREDDEGGDASPRRLLEEPRAQPGRLGEASLPNKRLTVPRLALGAVAVLVIGVGLYLALRPHRSPEDLAKLVANAQTVAATAAAKSAATAPPSTPAAPPTRAQQLVAQARALYEPWDFASFDDFKLAERLLQEAAELEPVNADAQAALAIVSFGLNAFGLDRSAARDTVLRGAAERAVKLAPDSDFTRLALALRYRRGPGMDDDALRLLLELEPRHRDDKFILRQIGGVLTAKNREADALEYFKRAADLPGGDAIALVAQARLTERMHRLEEAEALLNRAIALRSDYGYARVVKIALNFFERGDLGRTEAALREIPARVLGDERVAAVAAFTWYFARDTDKATDSLRYVSHDYIESNVVTMPKGLLAGLVHQLAGRPEAAAAEWRVALHVLEQRLALNPTSAGDVGDRAGLLALLGERAAAEEALKVYEQLARLPVGRATSSTWQIYAALGRGDTVADFFTERLKARPADNPQNFAAMFRFHPALDPLRSQPRFQALAAEVDHFYATANQAEPKAAQK